MITNRSLFLLVAAIFMAALAVPVSAQNARDLSSLRASMDARLPLVDNLKLQGLIGENNRGFIEARGRLEEEQIAIVQSENNDRLQVYTAIARQTGTTPERVGQLRAQAIFQASAPGVWVQTAEGVWTRKRSGEGRANEATR